MAAPQDDDTEAVLARVFRRVVMSDDMYVQIDEPYSSGPSMLMLDGYIKVDPDEAVVLRRLYDESRDG